MIIRRVTLLIVVAVFLTGCASTRIIIVEASPRGGAILLRGPEPQLAAHDYLANACPHGYRIVSEDADAEKRAVDLGNAGIIANVTTSLTYVCEMPS